MLIILCEIHCKGADRFYFLVPNQVAFGIETGRGHGSQATEGSVRLDAAVADLRRACELDPKNRDARAALSKHAKTRTAQVSGPNQP
jgi:hypothetical protein